MSLSLSIVKIIVLAPFVKCWYFTTASPPVPGGRGMGPSVGLRHDLAHLAEAAIARLRPDDVALRAGWLASSFQVLHPPAQVAGGDLAGFVDATHRRDRLVVALAELRDQH